MYTYLKEKPLQQVEISVSYSSEVGGGKTYYVSVALPVK